MNILNTPIMDQTNYKLVKVNEVIAEYNARYKNNPIDQSDAINWIYDCIRHVGSVDNYQHTEVKLDVKNHKVALPCDVYKISAVLNLNRHPLAYEDDGIYLNLYDPKTQVVFLRYWALPKDDDGYPLILEETKDAAVHFLFMRNTAEPDWYTGKISDQKYQMINQEYHRLVGMARGSLRHYSRNDMARHTTITRQMVVPSSTVLQNKDRK